MTRVFLRLLTASDTAGNKHSRINVLFPDPLTPDTATNLPSGNFTVKPFKLFLSALCSTSDCVLVAADVRRRSASDFRLWTLDFRLISRRFPLVGYFFFVRKHCPVIDS